MSVIFILIVCQCAQDLPRYLNKKLKISSCILYFSLEFLHSLGDRLSAGVDIGDPVDGNKHGSLDSRGSSHKMSLCFSAA